jgi:hypothetical protein
MRRRVVIANTLVVALWACFGLIAASTKAAEDLFTAKALLEWCTGEPQSVGDGLCTMYLAGYVSAAKIALKATGSQDMCLPEHLTVGEGRLVFVRMMRTQPDLLELPPDGAVWEALAQSFPCQKN